MKRPRILIVDDNRELADNLAEVLGDAGFSTNTYSVPCDVCACVHAGDFALALLDMRMPGMNGVELYRALKRLDPKMPAIAMTAYASDSLLEEARMEGFVDVWNKPVHPGNLVSRINALVGPHP